MGLELKGQLLKVLKKDWEINDNKGTTYIARVFSGSDVINVKLDEVQYNSLQGQEGKDVKLNCEPIVLKVDKPVLRLV